MLEDHWKTKVHTLDPSSEELYTKKHSHTLRSSLVLMANNWSGVKNVFIIIFSLIPTQNRL